MKTVVGILFLALVACCVPMKNNAPGEKKAAEAVQQPAQAVQPVVNVEDEDKAMTDRGIKEFFEIAKIKHKGVREQRTKKWIKDYPVLVQRMQDRIKEEADR